MPVETPKRSFFGLIVQLAIRKVISATLKIIVSLFALVRVSAVFNIESELATNKPKISSKPFDILRFENIFLCSFAKKNKIIDIINRYCVYPLNDKSIDCVDIWQNATIAAIEAEVPDKNILRSSAFIVKSVYGSLNQRSKFSAYSRG
tara:strand:- start:29 stop:472 length:444 start_codon:yes stop_codon:yes gene_type:complete